MSAKESDLIPIVKNLNRYTNIITTNIEYTIDPQSKIELLHIIFIIPMTVNDVNLSVSFKGVSGLSSWREKEEELYPEKRSCIFLCKNLIKKGSLQAAYVLGWENAWFSQATS